jgi:hypothetical protein
MIADKIAALLFFAAALGMVISIAMLAVAALGMLLTRRERTLTAGSKHR